MRIKAEINLDKIPFLNNHRFESLIKTKIARADQKYLHSTLKEKKQNLFTFALTFQDNYNRKNTKLIIDNDHIIDDYSFVDLEKTKIFLYISTNDEFSGAMILHGLSQTDLFDYSENNRDTIDNERIYMKIKASYQLPEKTPNTDTVTFKTMSPIVMDMGRELKYVTPNSMNFEKHLNTMLNENMNLIEKRNLYKDVKINILDYKISEYGYTCKSIRDRTNRAFLKLKGWSGEFSLAGDKRDLAIIYKSGIGSRLTAGFGMVDVAL
jgi:CRISPR-associated endoribonuclease Cas6